MLTFLSEIERMKPLLDSIGEGVLIADENGAPLVWNEAAERILGAGTLRRREGAWIERSGVFASDGTTPLPGRDRPLPRALRGEIVTDQEFVIRSENGDLVLVSSTARPLLDASARIVGGVAVFREITQRRRAENALRESERLYRTIADHLPSSVVMIFDRTLHFILAAGEGLATAGFTPAQVEGRPVAEVATPSLLDNYAEVFTGTTTDTEVERAGRFYRVQLVPVRDESDHIFSGLMLAQDITEERRRTEARGREEQLKLLAEAIPQIVWTANPDGGLDYYNERWFEYTGMSLEQTKGWGWQPVLHPDDLENCVDRWTTAVRTGNLYEVEYRFKRASDGAYRWHLGRALPLRDSAGAIVKWFGTCTDIDDQRRAKDALLEAQKDLEERFAQRTRELAASQQAVIANEARFRAAANGMKDAFYIMEAVRDESGDIRDLQLVDCNDAAAIRFRRRRDDLLGKRQSALAPHARSSGLFGRLVRVIETAQGYDEVVEIEDEDARSAWMHIRVVPLNNGIAVTSTDVTERRRMDEERDLHAAVVASISEGVCLVRASDRVILYANPKFVRMLGYEDGELEGKHASVLRPENPDASAADAVELTALQIRDAGVAIEEITNIRKDGRLIRCRATSTSLHRPEYEEVWVVVTEDITEQKRLEAERDNFFTMSPDMLCVVGLDGMFRQINPAWEVTLGWTLEELAAMPVRHLVHPDDQQATNAEGERLSEMGSSLSFENRYLCRDGGYRVLQWRAVRSAIHGATFAAARDVTPLREAQEALKASLAEKEVLLKEIHHRVKNNLQVISSLLKLHGDRISDPAARGVFQDSQDRVHAIALLHEKLYQSKNLGSVGMAEYGESLLQTLLRTHGAVAPARVSIDALGVSLPVDVAVPCGLILNELVTNALKHAFPARTATPPEIKVEMTADETQVTLSVSDNGVGLPADFELARSRTLGTQLVRSLARQLRAEIETTSALGTRWSLRFPRQPGSDS